MTSIKVTLLISYTVAVYSFEFDSRFVFFFFTFAEDGPFVGRALQHAQ